MRTLIVVAVVTVATASARAGYTPEQVLDAIHRVETSGKVGGPMWGDHHEARGPLQIHEGYFLDSGVAGTWADCDDLEFAKQVVRAYWRRYCPDALEAGDAQRLARCHNGGPRGDRKRATVGYWLKVKRELEAR